MRQLTTEGLDVCGGANACVGISNFLGKLQRSVPILITVEGSGASTRASTAFGLELHKSHPQFFEAMDMHASTN